MASAVVLALASAQAADVEQNVGRQFQALADEIERRGAKVGVAPMAISEVRRGSE
jgi:opacity protein-like surface antigen